MNPIAITTWAVDIIDVERVRLRALRQNVDGEELVTFYNSNFFGDNNADCLCGMEQLHGKQNVSSDETI